MNKLLVVAASAVLASSASATPLFSDDFNDPAGVSQWTPFLTSDAGLDYSYDYSALGIPSANGSDTLGIRFKVNDTEGAAHTAFAMSNTSFSGSFAISFDMYLHVADFELLGTTEFATYGLNATGAGSLSGASWSDGLGFANSLEGGSAIDLRVYDEGSQLPDTDAGFIADPADGNVDSTDFHPYYTDYFGDTGLPTNTWSRVTISQTVVEGGRLIDWSIGGLPISQRLVTSGSDAGMFYIGGADIFSSIENSDDVAVLYDNVEVVPEPASMLALGAGLAALSARRRRNK